MPLTDTNKGTNSDGSLNNEYCSYCYQKGQFTQDFTLNQMIEFCTQFITPMQTTLEDGTPYYYVGFTVKQNSINPLSVLHEGFYQTIWMVKLVFVAFVKA